MHTNPLGQRAEYSANYNSKLLYLIARQEKRVEIGVPTALPFHGVDIWNAYEISWLNAKGKPVVAIGEISVPCESPYLIESKSFKLYLNSFNNTLFDSVESVQALMVRDLSQAAGAPVSVVLNTLDHAPQTLAAHLSGVSLDTLDISCDTYLPAPSLLTTEDMRVTETLYSDLLKSNCLVTGQPDWGSVQITYTGKKISHSGLLRYIVSFRNHNEFHEQCVERMFMDITKYCQPESLVVYARYTRRGGLDINPWRGSDGTVVVASRERLVRQ